MSTLKVLICGGGCAGPALALSLSRAGHDVTVIERFPSIRASGAQIDLRGQGIEAARRLGILDAIRERRVDEDGVSFVDSKGRIRGTVLANKSGKGAQSLTSEYEIMRGDLVRVLYEATHDKVNYVFGKTVERFEQNDHGVTAYFSDGLSDMFDLLIGADGQGSRIRKAILPADALDPYRRLGVHIAYWFIPRIATDDTIMRAYFASGGRMIFRRSHSPTETQVYFFLRDDQNEASSIHRASVKEQKEFWTRKFRSAGWQTGRFLEGLETTDNFYCQEVVQVRCETWHKAADGGNRVVLLGDAAYCPSPFSGLGTTAAFVGAYVLAGEISKHRGDLPEALAQYEKVMRPFITEIQNVNPRTWKLSMPRSELGVSILYFILRLVSFLRLPTLLSRFSRENKGGWKLPEYPSLAPAKPRDE
jgi:2-polyprenyl-6-methoxyphenol hydroxylase-like FAD-dependent oxidoreductase